MNSLRQFDLNLLVLFEALITERHVSRAAEKVFLSQSAMSHALNRLREQLDDPLLIRTENGLQPTPRALEMLPEVRNALRQIERSLAPPNAFAPENSQRDFVIACTDYFEAAVFPQMMSYFQVIAPNITIEARMIIDDAFLSDLETGAVDLVVGMDICESIPSHLEAQSWITEQQICLLAKDNETHLKQLSLEDYIQRPHIVFSDLAGSNANAIDHWLAERKLSRRAIARTVNYMAAAKIVAQSQAIMTLPYQMGLLFSEMLPVRLVQPPEGLPSVQMTQIYHPLFAKEPGRIWLQQQVQHFGDQLLATSGKENISPV
ncbi:LysR family transcriptional regulator [Oceanospirillum maris]|uniref:LysR family transcriptional regulator n=1 Tax=Oceanospirillum maris TaxID=64977 RepID=UPI000420795A|nr:LysR family transcriptional regulator [Oceanospirillum maris]